jgi:sugar fermentation stimulation protein A
MRPSLPLIEARLVRRYKRFLADVRLEDGTIQTVHCPNTGAMFGCDSPGARVWLSLSSNIRRKYPLGWEVVESKPGVLVGINAGQANRLVHEALIDGRIEEIGKPAAIRSEVQFDNPRARIDFLLSLGDEMDGCLLEVKSVTAAGSDGVAFFPDAVSKRAVRHLDMLASRSRSGMRAVLFYCIQRDDISAVRAAKEIHPEYGDALLAAAHAGVEVLAYRCRVTPEEISVTSRVDVLMDVV